MPFMLEKRTANLSHMNTRREGKGGDAAGAPAVDLKMFLTAMPVALLNQVIPANGGDISIKDLLFTEDGAPRFDYVKKLELASGFSGCEVKVGSMTFMDANCKNFQLVKLHDGFRVDLYVTAQVHPDPTQGGKLMFLQKQDVDLTIGGDQKEIDADAKTKDDKDDKSADMFDAQNEE